MRPGTFLNRTNGKVRFLPPPEKEKKNSVVLETRREMSSIRADRDRTNAEEKESEIRRRLKLKHKRKAAELGTDNIEAIEGSEPEPGEPEAEAQAAAE